MSELNFIDFKCPYCSEMASFPDAYAGSAQECPNCEETVLVPAEDNQVGRPIPLPIKTPRLVLRRLRPHDWKDMLECLSDEELFLYVEGRPMEEEEIIRWLESDSHVKMTTPNQAFHLGIEAQETGKLIGYISLIFSEPDRQQAGVHLFINRSFQRKGFATEAVTAVLAFCFAGIRLHRVSANCDRRNAAALGLFEKAGFRNEGEFLQARWQDLQWVDMVWVALLREEYSRRDSVGGTGSPA